MNGQPLDQRAVARGGVSPDTNRLKRCLKTEGSGSLQSDVQAGEKMESEWDETSERMESVVPREFLCPGMKECPLKQAFWGPKVASRTQAWRPRLAHSRVTRDHSAL